MAAAAAARVHVDEFSGASAHATVGAQKASICYSLSCTVVTLLRISAGADGGSRGEAGRLFSRHHYCRH